MEAQARTQADQLIAIRSVVEGDEPFVFNSWLKSYRQSAFAKSMRNDIYFAFHHAIISSILTREGVEVIVATPVDDERTIIGWLAREGSTLHYVYVKEPFRRLGVARALAEGLPAAFRYTHRTPSAEQILRNHPMALFNPYLVWSPNNEKRRENTSAV